MHFDEKLHCLLHLKVSGVCLPFGLVLQGNVAFSNCAPPCVQTYLVSGNVQKPTERICHLFVDFDLIVFLFSQKPQIAFLGITPTDARAPGNDRDSS